MKRYLYDQILKDLKKKMVFITGPRQVGKTYLAKQLMSEYKNPVYLNYDNINDYQIIKKMSWQHNTDLIVFDEIHKMKNWKNYIKGVYDLKSAKQSILVTGSARLDTFRKTGDSLAGRYLHLRLNPISVRELEDYKISTYDRIELLKIYGGFPEPLISSIELDIESAQIETARWRNQYFTNIIREDIFDFSRIQEINKIKLLLQLLRNRVASPISYNSLAEDLQISPNTVKKYIQILESMYVIFMIIPYHRNIARSLLREPKIYFYDTGYIEGNDGIKLENTVALHLLKSVQYNYDVKGINTELYYLKTKDNKEIDFAIIRDNKFEKMIEVKLSDNTPSSSLKYFKKKFPNVEAIQLVHNLHKPESIDGIDILRASDWLNKLEV